MELEPRNKVLTILLTQNWKRGPHITTLWEDAP